jgi:outer membrane protein OmpA-like peptidoglycan-associated protein
MYIWRFKSFKLAVMNSRFIPITAFVIWSLVCWRWYVCGIKQVCATADASTKDMIQPVAPTTPAIDTTGAFAAQQAIQPAGSTTTGASKTPQKELTPDIESVQVVAVADHVLIHFPYGSTRRIDDDAIDAYLSELAQALISSGGRVSLIGHTDGIGDHAYNKAMSLDRAKHIRATLVKKGVKSSQVSVKGLGETKPISSNDNPQGRYKNRRVEVRIGKK